MKLELEIKSLDNVGEVTPEMRRRFIEIFEALVSSGALVGVRRGAAMIHFDDAGLFQSVELKYHAWRRRDVRG